MVESCANKITSYLIKKETIDADDYELYQYAFETIVALIIQLSIILIIGFTLNRFTETLLFLVFYCPIRQFSGGFHAENYRRCLLAFMILYLINTNVLEKIIEQQSNLLMIVITFISFIGIYFLAPQEHRNVPLTAEEKKRYKRITLKFSGLLVLLSAIGINFTITYDYAIYGASVIVCVYIMLILGVIKKGVTNL
ncbi:MAG: accessory gene regulator B family protein [Clostridioides difficile]|nr:accessory gene regulator B family protein [Clostridioides sp.]MBS5788649.1 accessory gene regulator B family protein [Clostridioides difficile]